MEVEEGRQPTAGDDNDLGNTTNSDTPPQARDSTSKDQHTTGTRYQHKEQLEHIIKAREEQGEDHERQTHLTRTGVYTEGGGECGEEEEGVDPRPPEAPLAVACVSPWPATHTTANLSGTLGDPAPGDEGGAPGGWVPGSSQNQGKNESTVDKIGGKQEIEQDKHRTTSPPSKTADRTEASDTHTPEVLQEVAEFMAGEFLDALDNRIWWDQGTVGTL